MFGLCLNYLSIKREAPNLSTTKKLVTKDKVVSEKSLHENPLPLPVPQFLVCEMKGPMRGSLWL